jgi:BirA family biotin operon repressor/biotin-[acetyl-CoA-carboxylase] ligase
MSQPRQPSTSRFRVAELRGRVRPFRLFWFARLRSTNDHAATLRRRGELYTPAIVLAGHQTAGRGRGANAWWSRAGCLTVTFAIPVEENLAPHELPLVAGLAARDAAAELSGEASIQLKWPNDVLFEDRKLAGLLCERVNGADLVGIGMNVNLDLASAPGGLRNTITSLSAIRGEPVDITDCLATLASHVGQTLLRRGEKTFPAFLNEYQRHHALAGRKITVDAGHDAAPISGRCEGIDAGGRLLLREGKTLHRVIAGHVTMRGPAR